MSANDPNDMPSSPETLRTYAAIFEKKIAGDINPNYPQAAPEGFYRDANPINVAAAKALRFMADHFEKIGEEARLAAQAVLQLGKHIEEVNSAGPCCSCQSMDECDNRTGCQNAS